MRKRLVVTLILLSAIAIVACFLFLWKSHGPTVKASLADFSIFAELYRHERRIPEELAANSVTWSAHFDRIDENPPIQYAEGDIAIKFDLPPIDSNTEVVFVIDKSNASAWREVAQGSQVTFTGKLDQFFVSVTEPGSETKQYFIFCREVKLVDVKPRKGTVP